MASKNFSLIDVQNDDQEIDLQFQDFGNVSTASKLGINDDSNEQTIYFSNFPDSHEDDQERLLGEDAAATVTKLSPSFWTFEYYQQFFNVESKQVKDRILWSMVPKPGVNFLQSYIRPNPDLYGPFWICVTLVFTTAITGNLANYLQTPDSYKWRYDFHKVTLATSCIFSYSWLVPLVLWGLLLLRGSKASLSLLELIALYGYSLAVFVPVSLLWMIPLKWLQWCLGIVASVLSGSVLVRTIHPAISHEAKRIALTIAALILLLHAALALGFMLYFFYPPNGAAVTAQIVHPLDNVTGLEFTNMKNKSEISHENKLVKNKEITEVKANVDNVVGNGNGKKAESVSKREDSQFNEDIVKNSTSTIDQKIKKTLINLNTIEEKSDNLAAAKNIDDSNKIGQIYIKSVDINKPTTSKVNDTALSKVNSSNVSLSKNGIEEIKEFHTSAATMITS